MHCSTVVKCIPWFSSSYSGIFFTYVVVTVRALYAPDTDTVYLQCAYTDTRIVTEANEWWLSVSALRPVMRR